MTLLKIASMSPQKLIRANENECVTKEKRRVIHFGYCVDRI